MEIALVLAAEFHRLDPDSAARLNFRAAKAYNRLLADGNHGCAELVYRFGRALTDRDRFPLPENETAGVETPAAKDG